MSAPGSSNLLACGLPRTTPVNLIEHQGRRWLVAPYEEVAWVRNVRAAGTSPSG